MRQQRSAFHEVLPDAAALKVGVYPLHRRGITGRGVRVGLADSGVGFRRWFEDRDYRLSGDGEPHPGHGTGMAALLFSIAPDVAVHSVSVRTDPLQGLQRLAAMEVDLILCAWGLPRDAEIDAATVVLQPRLLAALDPRTGGAPAGVPGTRAIPPQTPWPQGPFSLGEGGGPWQGLSVATALACALAALLLSAGVPTSRALAAVADPPSSDPAQLLHLLT